MKSILNFKITAISAIVLVSAIFGIAQPKVEAAQPGKVGNAPRCEVTTGQPRDKSFVVNGGAASVSFTAKGANNCKVRISANSFFAPSIDGKPYNAQILHHRNTKIVGKGTHTMWVNVPTSSTPQKGCFYQLDLTYGTHNVTPVIAYAHGTVPNCGQQPPTPPQPPTPEPPKPEPTPEAACLSLSARPVSNTSRTMFVFDAKAKVANGAKVEKYSFDVTGPGVNDTLVLESSELAVSQSYKQEKPGTYLVTARVQTSIGEKVSEACVAPITVAPEEPGKIEVCDTTVNKIVTIDKDEVTDKHTTDLTKCVVVTPTKPEQPKVLPNTGAGGIVSVFMGVTSLAGAIHYIIQRRFI